MFKLEANFINFVLGLSDGGIEVVLSDSDVQVDPLCKQIEEARFYILLLLLLF